LAGTSIKLASAVAVSATLLLASMLACGSAAPARAAFAGSPGVIAVERSPNATNSSEIWLLDWHTGGATQLTNKGYARDPAFSPSGEWVAFVSDLPRGFINVWAIRADGSGLRRLTKGHGVLEADSPGFSANGRWVAFTAEGTKRQREIDRVASSGGHRRVLVRPGGKVSAVGPAYSPDGRHLAWIEWRESPPGVPHLYVGRPDGSHARRLTAGSEPEFSPDGRSIVFVREGLCQTGRRGSEIDILNLGTDRSHSVTSSCGSEFDSPTFSPDGGWIAYTVRRGARSEIAFSQVPGVSSSVTPPAALGAEYPLDANPSWQPVQ
jgi:Tol biopolymer transport system component